ncbi:MAG: hypothetical protein QOD06_770 [Candidatus Binatota bacterium]|nr:hypothetical protein [Candidatus Binatota bacterium]
MATGMEPTVSDADRAHFRNVALDNAAVCERSLRDVMARSPGDRVAIALTLSMHTSPDDRRPSATTSSASRLAGMH